MSRILVTGSEGYLGQKVVAALAADHEVVGVDIVPSSHAPDYTYQPMDIRSEQLAGLVESYHIEQVVHLASIVKPSDDRERDYDIEVEGTRNVLQACIAHGVTHITVTSSGAAYGYHADNPDWLLESDPVRGNYHFSYSYHKRLVEEMLVGYRQQHPSLKQLILRPGTILGKDTDNLITRLFKRDRMLAICGSDSPFVFIWDEDVAAIILQGIRERKKGVYNVAGDGAMTVDEIAHTLNKPVMRIPASVLKAGLWMGNLLRLTPYGPEQLDFLRYRPVLDNNALKTEFGYQPRKTSREVFEYYARAQGLMP